MLIGPPLSGKDTYLRTINFIDFDVISRDDILMSLHGNNDYSEAFNKVDQKVVDKILVDELQDCIENKRNVIINMTNLSKKSRRRILTKFPSLEYERIAITFPKLSLDEYSKRNFIRHKEQNKFIPMNVIRQMVSNWEEVTYNEGFDKIINL